MWCCLSIVVQLPALRLVLSQTWTFMYMPIWVTNTKSPTFVKFGLSPMIFTAPNPCSLKIIVPSRGRRLYLGNGESTSLMDKISSGFVEHFAIDLLVFSSWCYKYYTFSPTPQVFNIIHSFTSFYEYPKKFTLIPKRWAY